MAASDEQIELLMSTDADSRAYKNHASMHHGHNLTGFDVKYGRKADLDTTTCCDTFLSCGCKMTCKRDKIFNFIECHVPVVNLIRTYKVCEQLSCSFYLVSYHLVCNKVQVAVKVLTFRSIMNVMFKSVFTCRAMPAFLAIRPHSGIVVICTCCLLAIVLLLDSA